AAPAVRPGSRDVVRGCRIGGCHLDRERKGDGCSSRSKPPAAQHHSHTDLPNHPDTNTMAGSSTNRTSSGARGRGSDAHRNRLREHPLAPRATAPHTDHLGQTISLLTACVPLALLSPSCSYSPRLSFFSSHAQSGPLL